MIKCVWRVVRMYQHECLVIQKRCDLATRDMYTNKHNELMHIGETTESSVNAPDTLACVMDAFSRMRALMPDYNLHSIDPADLHALDDMHHAVYTVMTMECVQTSEHMVRRGEFPMFREFSTFIRAIQNAFLEHPNVTWADAVKAMCAMQVPMTVYDATIY